MHSSNSPLRRHLHAADIVTKYMFIKMQLPVSYKAAAAVGEAVVQSAIRPGALLATISFDKMFMTNFRNECHVIICWNVH